MSSSSVARFRTNFFTGLAVVSPVVISIAVMLWLFGTVANVTDTLLFFLPRRWIHQGGGTGPIYWYWSLVALLVAVLLVNMVGRLTRYYIGRQAIELLETAMLSVPLLNKIYSAIKQVNDAFSPNKDSSFRQVVLIEFPRAGQYSLGFITSQRHPELPVKDREGLISVFIPTTPNPTTGFLILVPENQVTRIQMSVADGIKFIISLGSLPPNVGGMPFGNPVPAA